MKQSYNIIFSSLFILLIAFSASPLKAEWISFATSSAEFDVFQFGNARPVLSGISPESAIAGEVVDVLLNGAHFESGITSFAITGTGVKVIRTLVVSSFQLRVTLSIDPKAPAGLRTIRVINSPPAGGSSSSVTFRVKSPPNPVPILTRISPTSSLQGDTLTTELIGKNFVPGQTFVVLDGDGIKMDSIMVHDSNRITVKLIINEVAKTGRTNFAVVTPGPGGGKSQARSFVVQMAPYPVPRQLRYEFDGLIRGETNTVELFASGIREATRLILPDGLRPIDAKSEPPNRFQFSIDIPEKWSKSTFPILLNNPRPGGGLSDTLFIPILRPKNTPPKANQMVTGMRIAVGETVTIPMRASNPIFIDADGDSLTYSLLVDETAAFAEIRNGMIYLRGNNEGKSNVSVIASDGFSDAIIVFPVNVFIPIPNKSPTLSPLTNIEIPANVLRKEISLAGISAGNDENQRLTVTATSSNTQLIPNPEVVYTSPNTTGSIIIRPTRGITGSAVITVRVRDNGGREYNGVDQISRSFTINVRETDISESDEESPGRFRLAQNYPNPFNPTTTIEYTIGEASFVRLGIFDVTGRLVARLVEREQTSGTYTVSYTADKIPSGMYIYRLEAGSYTQTRTMSLVK
jgi:hypothetical protein